MSPISISAYSQAELDRLNIKTIEDIRYSSPSLYIAPTSFRQDTLNITIRGQRNFDALRAAAIRAWPLTPPPPSTRTAFIMPAPWAWADRWSTWKMFRC